jgi:hypothetical protein
MRRQDLPRGYDDPKKLILAAADCAEDATDKNDNPIPPPPELSLAWQFERWGVEAVLPGPLPVRLLRRMNACLNVYTAFQSYQAGKYRLADWGKANPSHLQIVSEIRLMRMQNAR